MISKTIDGANGILMAQLNERLRHTENCRHTVGGEMAGPASGLAICQHEGEAGFYLFGCDAEWKVVTDTFHQSLVEAKSQAEFEYEGVAAIWQGVDRTFEG